MSSAGSIAAAIGILKAHQVHRAPLRPRAAFAHPNRLCFGWREGLHGAQCTVHGACPTLAQEAGLSPEAAVLSPLGEGARALWPTDNADMSKAHAHGSLALDSHELGSRLSSANSDWLEGGPANAHPSHTAVRGFLLRSAACTCLCAASGCE